MSKLPPPSESATVETDLFEFRIVKENFINPCCFGEDFGSWLRSKISLPEEFALDDLLQEDYGWGFFVNHPKGAIWVSLGCATEAPAEGPAKWIVTVTWHDLNLVRRWFRSADESVFDLVAGAVWSALRSEPAIVFLGYGDLI
jgi:hypothetical protein